jgi:transcriptional regulator with XRE-family HTH domain
MITPDQCRAARALLRWTQEQLAETAGVGVSTVEAFEAALRQPIDRNRAAIRQAFEAAGIAFIPENGGGAGVRFRSPTGE